MQGQAGGLGGRSAEECQEGTGGKGCAQSAALPCLFSLLVPGARGREKHAENKPLGAGTVALLGLQCCCQQPEVCTSTAPVKQRAGLEQSYGCQARRRHGCHDRSRDRESQLAVHPSLQRQAETAAAKRAHRDD